jgi:hypothetical protein
MSDPVAPSPGREVSVVLTRSVLAAAALAAAVAVSTAVVRDRRLHRVLQRERAAHRLMDGRLLCDMQALHARLNVAMARQEAERAVLREAGLVLDEALALHAGPCDSIDPFDPFQEGGPA